MKYILAADDEPVNRLILEESLAKDFELIVVENGLECLNRIEDRCPDLLLLDLAMPVMDGMTVLKELRNNEKTRHLTIIVFSGFASETDIDEAMAAGATQYITKPFKPSKLLELVVSYLN